MSQNRRQSGRIVLILSDHPPLNRAHAEFLRLHGYQPLTAVTYTDAVRLMEQTDAEKNVYAVVVASKIHGWHHLEGEAQPPELAASADSWQLDNIREVYELVADGQDQPPLLLITRSLIETGWYQITEEALAQMDLPYRTYSASHLNTLAEALEDA
jgi:hypothetical protein